MCHLRFYIVQMFYPTPDNQIRLNAIENLKKFPDAIVVYQIILILYTHVLGSIALGASIVEKHFVISKLKDKGPDVSASMDVDELKRTNTWIK